MTDTLLTSPNFVKSITNISDNVNEKVLLAAIRESQEIELKEILGCKLLNKMKDLISTGDIDLNENESYKKLLDQAQYFLAYTVVAKLCIMLSYKIDNIGVVKTVDENVESVELSDIYNIQEFNQHKADHFCYQLQLYILNNIENIPEITESQCRCISATLYSAANPALWLGGARGKGCGYRLKYKYE